MIEGSNGVASKIDENKVVPESIEGPDEKSTVDSNVFKDIGFKPKFSYFSGSHRTINLRWSELSLSIGDKNILKNINGRVSSGSVSALMGPSGSGKSSLLNVLAGRVLPSRRTKISGDILVNGRKIKPVQFRQNLAYVMQEDLLYATATAREAIEFSAHLRLPKVISRNPAKIKQIVDDLLDSLGLSHVHDTMVGSEKLRGLSGGEKKRVAIGVELVTNPSLLFLDEPTSGLDSFSAWKVVKILKALGSATGCAIVCSIHQPNSEIFQSFDSVNVLSEGRVMYGGTVKQMPQILKGLGKPIPEMTNPADFILLLAQTSSDDKNFSYNLDKSISKSPDVLKNEIAGQQLCDESKDSVGAMQQSFFLAKRELLNLKRDYMTLLVGGSLSFTMNLIFGIFFLNVGDRDHSEFNLQYSFGAIVMIITTAMFAAAEAPLLQFPLENGIFLREYRTGTYSVLPYFFSKLLIEIPRSLLNPTMAWLGAYFLVGFKGNVFVFICIGWMLSLSVASYAVFIGSAASSPKNAQAFATLILVPQLLFSGISVPLEVIPSWISWAQYLCVLKYAVNLIVLEEMNECSFSENELAKLPQLQYNCTELFEVNDIDPNLWWRDVLLLIAVFLGFRTFSILILKLKADKYS